MPVALQRLQSELIASLNGAPLASDAATASAHVRTEPRATHSEGQPRPSAAGLAHAHFELPFAIVRRSVNRSGAFVLHATLES